MWEPEEGLPVSSGRLGGALENWSRLAKERELPSGGGLSTVGMGRAEGRLSESFLVRQGTTFNS